MSYVINVLNKHHGVPDDAKNVFYIGRGSVLGNQASHLPNSKATVIVEDRHEAINWYDEWLEDQIKSNNEEVCNALNEIASCLIAGEEVNLVCYCAPVSCHGHIIKRTILEALGVK